MRVLTETNRSKKIFRKARLIAAKGLVNRENDLFRISSPSLKGKEISYKVWRNKEGKIRCSCAEFENKIIRDLTFRCEHILAVKFALKYKNTESALKKRMKIETQIEIKSKSKNATVSLESKGGEQKLDESREEISTNGQVEEVRYLETNLLANKKGEKNMKQETLPPMDAGGSARSTPPFARITEANCPTTDPWPRHCMNWPTSRPRRVCPCTWDRPEPRCES